MAAPMTKVTLKTAIMNFAGLNESIFSMTISFSCVVSFNALLSPRDLALVRMFLAHEDRAFVRPCRCFLAVLRHASSPSEETRFGAVVTSRLIQGPTSFVETSRSQEKSSLNDH